MTIRSAAGHLSTWFMERYVTAGSEQAGDLLEQFHRGRSTLWLAKQVAGTAVVAAGHELRRDWRLGVRAALTAFAAYVLVATFTFYVLGARPFSTTAISGIQCAWHFVAAFAAVALHRRLPLGTMMLLVGWVVLSNAPETWRTASNALLDARYEPYFWDHLLQSTLDSFATLAGALVLPPVSVPPQASSRLP